ncbi:MAG: DUF4838 domain-containing protein [Fimbriimonadaceae bacterium]|nr:DUF4838 domain-containing protein [Fimbriimonadaceae bacterium]
MTADLNRRTFVQAAAATGGALLLPRSAAAQAALDLARDGRSPYQIVLPVAASPSQRYAASELQSFFEQITGAKLPVLDDAAPLPAQAILLGLTRHTGALLGTLDLKALGDDGFRLVSRGAHLCLLGGPVRGTLYAVYELLEKHGGCRWYSSFHSAIPRRPTWTLPALDETQRPAFAMREPFWSDMFPGSYAARCKANGNRMELSEQQGGKIRFGGGLFVHTFYPLLPPEEFFGPHPEYYSERNGRRTADYAQLCLTNPKVVELVTARVLERIRKDPGAKLFSVSQNDWHGNCQCAACRAIDEREGSPAGSLIHFVNQVADVVGREFPEVWLETLAYQYTRKPPQALSPRPNVVPRLCTIECDFSKPLPVSTYEQNQRFVADIQGWSKVTDKLYIWDYVTNFAHYTGPHPNFGALQGNVRFFRDNKVVGLFEQGAYQGPHAEFAELRAWLLAKLLWNPDVDTAPLLDDWFGGTYGPAAELVRTYFDELQALVKGPEVRLTCYAPMTAAWYSDAFFQRAAKLFAEAEQRVKDDAPTLWRVKLAGLPVLYAREQRWPAQTVRRVLRDDLLEPQGVDPEYRTLATELLTRLESNNVRIAEGQERHDGVLRNLRSRTVGYRLTTLRSGPLQVGISPDQGGAALTLREGADSYLAPELGGVELVDGRYQWGHDEGIGWKAVEVGAAHQALERGVSGGPWLRRRWELANGGLQATQSWTARGTNGLAPLLRAAVTLGDGIALRLGNGPWQPLAVPPERAEASFAVRGEELQPELTLASSTTGRAVRWRLPQPLPERLVLLVGAPAGSVRLYAPLPPQSLANGAVQEVQWAVRPLTGQTDLPAVAVTPQHQPQRVTIDDGFFSLGRPGEWGALARDAEAPDGWAIKLFNTHYEWCLTWPIDPSRFSPGASYTVRARLKVERSERAGEAFWAGVYDVTRAKGWGQINPSVAEVKPGYQWYDLATWQPESGQYVWVGPGRFDLKGGAKSAIEGLWVDQYEFVQVV